VEKTIHGKIAGVVSAAPAMTSQTALLFVILWDARNRLVSYEHIADVFFALYDSNNVTPRSLASVLKRLRKRIPEDWPVEIETKYQLGYRLMVDPKWTWE
jgi:DNA-binding response OmpR family regulator